jgi:butyryl-CoA dehydrogenase
VKERNLYGVPMTMLQPISYWLADAHTKIEACRAMLYNTTQLFDQYRFDPNLVMACKIYICETAKQVCDTLLQMWGGSGIMNDVGVNRYLRDARTNTIAEGASEILMTAIAQSILQRDALYS